jgi:hypothetical protein
MSGFSAALLVSGLCSPRVGRWVDRYGGHRVIPIGSLIGAAGLASLPFAESAVAWLACWCVIGAGMAATLYDAAFATLGRIFGNGARKPLTWLTLLTGFASTLSWPATHVMLGSIGWRETWLVYAALLALVSAPLAALGLPRSSFLDAQPAAGPGRLSAPSAVIAPHGLPFLLTAGGFAAYGFYHGGYSAHALASFNRLGLDAGTVVALAAISGPAQVATRLVEIVFGRGMHPLWMARAAVAMLVCAFGLLATFGVTTVSVAAFFLMYGIANGLFTIARGALPLALFGPVGYGHVMGRIAMPFLVMQALAPIVLALVIERVSDAAALGFIAAVAVVSLACFALLRRP